MPLSISVKASIRGAQTSALAMMVANRYDNRDKPPASAAVDALLAPYRVYS